MRVRKALISLLLGVVVVLETITLGWIATAEHNGVQLATHTLRTTFAIYLLVVAARSVRDDVVASHGRLVVHLGALTTLTALLWGCTAILPDTPPVSESMGAALEVKRVCYVNLGLYAVLAITTMTTPRGPKLHYPPQHIYSEKIVLEMTNTDRENVCGALGQSTICHVRNESLTSM